MRTRGSFHDNGTIQPRVLAAVLTILFALACIALFVLGNSLGASIALAAAVLAGLASLLGDLEAVRTRLARAIPTAAVETYLRRPPSLTQHRDFDWDPSPPFLYEGEVRGLTPPRRCGDWIEWLARGTDALWTVWEIVWGGATP